MVWNDLDLLSVYDTVVFLIVLGVCVVYLPIVLSSKPDRKVRDSRGWSDPNANDIYRDYNENYGGSCDSEAMAPAFCDMNELTTQN